MSDFAAFARGSICSTFIDSVPLIESARATSTVEMALSVLMDRRKEWEDTFVKKFGVPVDSEVGLPKMIGAFCVMARCSMGALCVHRAYGELQLASPRHRNLRAH